MPTDHRAKLATIKRFDQLIAYLRDEMGWPIENGSSFEDLTFEYLPDELGIDSKTAAKIQEIKRLRPLTPRQPWGIFFVKFEPKRLPVVALRRILGQVALKKRASANSAERAAWAADDLLFVSNYGEGDERQISFAHFSRAQDDHDLPTLKVLGWDGSDTALHLDAVARELTAHLAWPDDESNAEGWRKSWRAAFTLGHREVVTTSKDLSIRLAELARAIRDRIEAALAIETDKGPLTLLMRSFQTALVHDLDGDGFADMYAQTIAYGLLSARIAAPDKRTADDFAAHMRTNPFLRELMETFLKVGGRKGKAGGQGESAGIDFDELGVSEVVELLDTANMEAVVRDFGDRNPQEDPVIHFYELFLKEYDANKRMSRGVFYTPRPVVSYIVRSVDELLRDEFGLDDGLADTVSWSEMAARHPELTVPEGVSPDQDFVQILDPATGTGTFLVEVIDLIHATLVSKWKLEGRGEREIDALWNEYVPKHLLTRLHGYELLMAPYAIAHLKIGLKLYETGYRFGSDERARVYLTNALEPADDNQHTLVFLPALAHEAQAVNAVKSRHRFTVVLGNPPYSGISSNMTGHAQALVDAYRTVDGAPLNERKLWLQDDYVKFIRHAQVTIDNAGIGLLGYITNHGYVDNPTFRGMRQSLISSFRSLRVVDLHGNALKKERAPDGTEDKNVFEIRQGVSICFGARHFADALIARADLWGSSESKCEWLGAHSLASTPWCKLDPTSPFYFFRAADAAGDDYSKWAQLSQLMPTYSSGIITARDELVLDFEPGPILQRVGILRDNRVSDDAIRRQLFAGKSSPKYPAGDSRGWKLPEARKKLSRDGDWQNRIAPCLYRPFDRRYVYMTEWMVDWSRPELRRHLERGRNPVLVFPRNTGTGKPWDHAFVSYEPILGRFFPDSACITYMAPLLVNVEGMFGQSGGVAANFQVAQGWEIAGESDVRRRALSELGYVYSILYSPAYRRRYQSDLRADFPRIPVAADQDLIRALSQLGRELIALHLMEAPELERFITVYSGPENPEVVRVGWSGDAVWLDAASTKRGQPTARGAIGFQGVDEAVWNFQIGGYQVCEKWLKDRQGRRLTRADITHYQKIVVAVSATIRLMEEIDEVIEQHGGWPGAFQGDEAKAEPATVLAFRPRTVEPKPTDRYTACLPLIPLKAAAGAFSDPQRIQQEGWDDEFEWVAVESRHRLRQGMFVGQVVGKSMEPAIPDGSWCLFRAPVEGTRNGKIVLVQLRDAADPESGERYTVKRYESEKSVEGDSWHHERITLKPVNHDFAPIVLAGRDAGELQVVAEVVEVLDLGAQAPTAPSQSGVGPKSVDSERLQQTEVESAPGTQRDGRPDPPGEDSKESPPPGPDFDADEFPCQIRSLFADGKPRDRESAIRELREQLGFKRTGHVLREALDNGIRTAVRRGILKSEGGVLKLHLASIDDFDRDFLKEQFMASLGGRAWRERAEAARVLARFLGFRRTGPAIEDAARSIINGLLREGRLEARASEIRRVD